MSKNFGNKTAIVIAGLAAVVAGLNVKTAYEKEDEVQLCLESEKILREQRSKMLEVLIDSPMMFVPNDKYCEAFQEFEREKLSALLTDGKCDFLNFTAEEKAKLMQMRISVNSEEINEDIEMVRKIRNRVKEAATLPVQFEMMGLFCDRQKRPDLPTILLNY